MTHGSPQSFRFVSTLQLPFDVIETIGGYLWNSGATVQACVLTCRLWYNAIRPTVYRKITLHGKDDAHKLRRMIDSEPAIGQWIRELQISYSERHLGVYDWFLGFPEILHPESLGNLCTLQFRSQEAWHMSTLQSRQAVNLLPRLAGFTTITHLSFVHCVVPYDLTKAIVCCFPALQDLHMHSVICTQPNHRFELPIAHQPHNLRSIRIHADNRVPADGFYPELLLSDMPPFARSMRSLTTLQFHFGANTTTMLQDLAKIVFPSEPIAIEHLEFYFPICKGYSPVALASCNRFIVENLNISMFTSLRTFHLRGLNQAEMTFAVIHALNSPELYQVTLGIVAAALDSSQRDNYTLVDTCLAGAEKFSNLKSVHVFSYDTGVDDISSVTQKAQVLFPRVCERGLLETSLIWDPDHTCELFA